MDRGHDLFVSSDGSVESGWTVYLENSSSSSLLLLSRRIGDGDSFDHVQKRHEHELDLSMVSDASSGPQISRESDVAFPENETAARFCDTTAARLPKSGRKMKAGHDTDRRRRRWDRQEQQTTSFLDDTASSDPNFNFNNSESSSCQNQFNTSLSGNQRQKNQWFKGRRDRD